MRAVASARASVQQHIAEELDKRLGPAPVGASEEALAERDRANKTIRELRKQLKQDAAGFAETENRATAGEAGAELAPSASDAHSTEERPTKRRKSDTEGKLAQARIVRNTY